MAYQLWIADAARAAGLKVIEEPGWKTRGSSTFDPKGVICHHTAIDSDTASVRVVRDGRSDLQGPLSQFVLAKDGTVYVIAAGKANHAGEGRWREMLGNTTSFGIEAVNKGNGTPWPVIQLDAYKRLCAALLKHMKRTAQDVAAHREYCLPVGRKIDPKGIDMVAFRKDIDLLLKPMEIKPMFDPPIVMPLIVAALKSPEGGVWLLGLHGEIYAFECADKDAPNRHPEYWSSTQKAARLESFGNGYTVIDSEGQKYAYP